MSKKSARRPRMAPGKAQPRTYSETALPAARIAGPAQAQQAPANPAQRSARTMRQVSSAPVDLATEYAHVRTDLRRVLMIAGSLLVLLIALSFVIH